MKKFWEDWSFASLHDDFGFVRMDVGNLTGPFNRFLRELFSDVGLCHLGIFGRLVEIDRRYGPNVAMCRVWLQPTTKKAKSVLRIREVLTRGKLRRVEFPRGYALVDKFMPTVGRWYRFCCVIRNAFLPRGWVRDIGVLAQSRRTGARCRFEIGV